MRRSLGFAIFVTVWATACGGESERHLAPPDGQGGTGGGGGGAGMSAAGTSGVGGSGPILGQWAQSCQALVRRYEEAKPKARTCVEDSDCSDFVNHTANCGCSMPVADRTELDAIDEQWNSYGCGTNFVTCVECAEHVDAMRCTVEGFCIFG